MQMQSLENDMKVQTKDTSLREGLLFYRAAGSEFEQANRPVARRHRPHDNPFALRLRLRSQGKQAVPRLYILANMQFIYARYAETRLEHDGCGELVGISCRV